MVYTLNAFENLDLTMDISRPPPFRFVAASLLLTVSSIALADEVAGQLNILDLESKVFGNTRKIRVWLPYDDLEGQDQDIRYPVLYLNDGQDIFDATESTYFATEWMVDETAIAIISDGTIGPIIVVGIDHGGRSGRAREYLPYPDKYLSPPEPSPSGALYASFLETEVIPFIEDRYPVRSDKSGRTLGGSSYGALVALYVAVTSPELFGQLLLESPSFYVDDNRVLRDVERIGLEIDRVYLGAGTNEIGVESCGNHASYLEVARGALDLTHVLIEQDFPVDHILVNIIPCANHSPAAWAQRLPAALLFLYSD